MPYKSAKKGKGKTVVYSGDSNVLIRKDGTIAWRNNNPGNMKCDQGNFAKRHGAIGCDGTFAVFPDVKTGRSAQTALLKTKKYQSKSIRDVIRAYSSDGNEANYIKYVAGKTGLSADKKLGDLKQQEFSALTASMRRFEGAKAGAEVTLPHPDKYKNLFRSPRTFKIPSRHIEVFSRRNLGAHHNSGETLKREGDKVFRIEGDGNTRGYFISE